MTIGTQQILEFVIPLVYGCRHISICLLTALTVFFGYQASLLRPDTGYEKQIPSEHPFMQVMKRYALTFGGANVIYVPFAFLHFGFPSAVQRHNLCRCSFSAIKQR